MRAGVSSSSATSLRLAPVRGGLLACLVWGLLATAVLPTVSRAAGNDDVSAQSLAWYKVRLTYLATYLAKQNGSAAYLVITPKKTEANDRQHDALVEILGKAGLKVSYHEVTPLQDAPAGGKPAVFVTAQQFDTIIGKYAEVDFAISTFGLPQDYRDLRLWRLREWKKLHNGKAPPKLILLDSSISDLKVAIRAGLIQAVVHPRPGASQSVDEPVPADLDEAFNKRYLLVTPQNVEKLDTTYRDLFPTGKIH